MEQPKTKGWLNETKCPMCGKLFYPTQGWVYTHERERYCSWKCYRQKMASVKEKKSRRKLKKVYQYTLANEFVREFTSVNHAADYILGTYSGISQSCTKNKPYKGYFWRYKKDALPEV